MKLTPSPAMHTGQWQRIVEINYEAGCTPILGFGIDTFHPESILSLLALKRLSQRALPAHNAALVVGGEGELWLAAAMQISSARGWLAQPASLQMETLYAGSDLATQAATLNIATSDAPVSDEDLLPTGMGWMLTPTAVPGSERVNLDELPFILADTQFSPVPPVSQEPGWMDHVEGWSAFLLVLVIAMLTWIAV